MKGFLLSITLFLATSVSGAQVGEITAARISGSTYTDAWVLEVDIYGLSTGGSYAMGLTAQNDPTSAKIVLSVRSQGYDSTGTATTRTRTVYGTKQLRKPYPNQLQSDESESDGTVTVKVALSDFIYESDDQITATIASGFYTEGGDGNLAATGLSVSNGSTAHYPKAIGHFVSQQRLAANGVTTVEVFAVHRLVVSGSSLACVKITCTGLTSSHVVTSTATSMSHSSYGDKLPVFAFGVPLSTSSGFTRGEVVKINFTAYPLIGDSGAILDSEADAAGTVHRLGPLYYTIMDKMIAVVDPSNGNDTTGTASTTQATADAAPCQTINGALTKIAAANNSAYSLDRCDGGEVQCKAGTYKVGKPGSQTVLNGCVTITSHSSASQSQVVFDGYEVSRYQYKYYRLHNVTIDRASDGVIVFGVDQGIYTLSSVAFSDSYGAWYSGSTDGSLEMFGSSSGNSTITRGGNDGKCRIIRACTFTGSAYSSSEANCVVTTASSGSSSLFWHPLIENQNNIVIAYNTVANLDGNYFITCGRPISGVAIINNLVERLGSSATPLAEMSSANIGNILIWGNTFAGQRFNHENDIGAPFVDVTLTQWSGRNNIFNSRGDHRADIYDSTSTMTGSWSVGYSVGWVGNYNEAIAFAGDTDFWGLWCNSPSGHTRAGFTVDASYSGSDEGGGDYQLLSDANALLYACSKSMPYDLIGNARNATGTSPGAYEYFVATTPSTPPQRLGRWKGVTP